MEINKWVRCYKVRVFPWIDSKRIYINVQYFYPGQSIERPPAIDKTVYLTDNENGRKLIENSLDSLVEHIAKMTIANSQEITITA